MFGSLFGSSSSSEPKPPTKQERQACWDARDAYFACLDKNNVLVPAKDSTKSKCPDERAIYESNCPKLWVEHFLKRRVMEARQKQMQPPSSPDSSS